MQALHLVQERKDLDPELRSSVVDAITHGRIDKNDDATTMLALQDLIFSSDSELEAGEVLKEIGKGNIRIDSANQLLAMQKNLNKGEKNLVRKVLHILDASFSEAFQSEPNSRLYLVYNENRLAARKMYLNSLKSALSQNDTARLIQLTNSDYTSNLGRAFISNHAKLQYQSEQDLLHHIAELQKQHLPKDKGEIPKYTEKAFASVKKINSTIIATSKASGVPAMAIAGAIVDESSAQENRFWAKFDPKQNDYVLKHSSLEDVRENIKNDKNPLEKIWNWRIFPNSIYHDVGPGNFKVKTAYNLFEQYILQVNKAKKQSKAPSTHEQKLGNSIRSYFYGKINKNASDDDKWNAYLKHMVLTVEGTAWLAAAEMLKGREALEEKQAMDGLSDLEKTAVMMTWYKQGDGYLKRFLDSRLKGRIGPIQPGEGSYLFHYYDKFTEVLK